MRVFISADIEGTAFTTYWGTPPAVYGNISVTALLTKCAFCTIFRSVAHGGAWLGLMCHISGQGRGGSPVRLPGMTRIFGITALWSRRWNRNRLKKRTVCQNEQRMIVAGCEQTL